jgi:hypothetical protein
MTDEMVIRINPSDGRVSVDEIKDGITSRKNIDTDTLLECLQYSTKCSKVSSGLLPPNVISFAYGDDGSFDVCLRHPELRGDIIYAKTEYRDLPLPRLVFGFNVSAERRISKCRLGVAADERFKPETPMYAYPFSNVNGFSLCIGGNPLPKCESLHTLASVPYLLLAMPNNNDRFTPRRNKKNLEFRDLLELLRDKDSAYYYSDILIENKKTLQDFILRAA